MRAATRYNRRVPMAIPSPACYGVRGSFQPTVAPVGSVSDTFLPEHFINRELSWLEFNARVLAQARMARTPWLERLKFLSIFAANLDEFYMIRVANLRDLEVSDHVYTAADGLTPVQQLDAIAARTRELVDEQYRILRDEVMPVLEEHGVRFVQWDDLGLADQARLTAYFHRNVFPVLTPLTVDPAHPFPYLSNLSVNLAVEMQPLAGHESERSIALVEVPTVLDRLIPLDEPESEVQRFMLLDDLIAEHVDELFPGLEVEGTWRFRVTRNADLSLEDQEAENLLQDIERELRTRTFRPVVRLEIEENLPEDLVEWLLQGCQSTRRKVFRVRGPLHVPSLMRLYGLPQLGELKDPPFNPRLSPRFAKNASIFSVMRDGDVLLHHPYESFSSVAELISHASADARVLAIKLTLYRTSGDSVIIQALKEAAQNGKQVTAIVELKARFDEKNNIVWARELERAGAHVVYGMVGLKTHCKVALVVRQERGQIQRYVHLSTGNYNSSTARLYTDVGLLTCDPAIAEDVSHLFNVLTSYSRQTMQAIAQGLAKAPAFNKITVAPFRLRERFVELIEQEIAMSTPEDPGLIRAKCNSLSDPGIIALLYRASRAGVRVELNVRGICCLRPGIPGLSETIRVVSIVDRFLEHSRVFHFRHGGADLVLMSSADWMTRNLNRRIETMFPIEDPLIKARVLHEILDTNLADNQSAWELQADGRWIPVVRPHEPPIRSQDILIRAARDGGLKQPPYDETLRSPRLARREPAAG